MIALPFYMVGAFLLGVGGLIEHLRITMKSGE